MNLSLSAQILLLEQAPAHAKAREQIAQQFLPAYQDFVRMNPLISF